MIEGLTKLEGPSAGHLSSHKFSLPPGFDSTRYASKWVEDGPDVIEAAQPQVLEQAGVKADGWAVYKVVDTKKLEGDKKTPIQISVMRTVGKKTFILLFRPKSLQAAVNAIYADSSRKLVNQEVRGEIATANQNNDPGVLTNADLRKFSKNFEDEGESYLPSNSSGQPTRLQEAQDMQLQ